MADHTKKPHQEKNKYHILTHIFEIQENDTDELWKAATDPQTQKQSYGY